MWLSKKNTIEDRILEKYRQLKRTQSGSRHAERYEELKILVRMNQNGLFSLIFSGKLTADEQLILIWFGGHGGSCAKRHNEDWVHFVSRIRERQAELSEEIQRSLDWYLKVHGW